MPRWIRFGQVLVLLTLIVLAIGGGEHMAYASAHAAPSASCDPKQGSCDGADPRTSGCWLTDGVIQASTTRNNQLADPTPMETDLLWSQICQTWWAHTYATSLHATNVPMASTIQFCPTQGACWVYGAEAWELDGWTPMFAFSSGGTPSACGSPADQYSVGGSCTNKMVA